MATALNPSSGWQYYNPLTVNGAITDYQMKLDMRWGSGTDDPANGIMYGLSNYCSYDDMRDHRFATTNNQSTAQQLYEWTESVDAGVNRVVWVKIETYSTIYLYAGNSGASEFSDGSHTFNFFDDFEDGDVSDWTNNSYGTWEAQTSLVKHGSYAAKGVQTSTSVSWTAYKSLGLSLSDGYAYRLYTATNDAADVYKYINTYTTNDDSKIMLALRLGYMAYHDGTAWNNIIAISDNTWYLIELKNFTADGYDIYINGTLEVSQATYYNSSGYLTYSGFRGSYTHTTGDIYVDDVLVRKYASTEPSWSFGSWTAFMKPIIIINPSFINGFGKRFIQRKIKYDTPDFVRQEVI